MEKIINGSTESFECSKVQVEVQIAQYNRLLKHLSISLYIFPRRMDQSIRSFLIETGLNLDENALGKFSFGLL